MNAMNEIWANRLIGGTQEWTRCPAYRKEGVKTVLTERVKLGIISADHYVQITGETLELPETEADPIVPA